MSGGLNRCMLLVVLGILMHWADKKCQGRTVEMRMIYRYSDEFKALRGRQMAAVDWSGGSNGAVSDWRTGSLEQHEELMRRDRMRYMARGRGLLSGTFLSPSNETIELDPLGGLHYSFITIGTPNQTFLVALDTGSDLLWVPCNCQQCSSTNWASYGIQDENLQFSEYEEASSSTSKSVACTDSVCSKTLTSSTNSCTSADERCSYLVQYMSTGTSTSGVIVEDLLYLNDEASSGGSTSTIYFGCGQAQTGDLLQGVAPNGLFGLGPDQISVPSTLARNGVIPANAFSMCFSSSDASGRLVFGIQAQKGFPSTPLLSVNPSVYYVVETTKFSFGEDSVSASEKVIFDTGTSYTALPESTYRSVGNMLNKQISAPQFQLNGTFDYCWNTSDSNVLNSLPTLSMTFSGGSTWNITSPYVIITDQKNTMQFFCLGITPSSTAIIGHNFMAGYEFFFNQESMTFSWSPSTCYNLNGSTAVSTQEEPTFVNRASTQSSSAHSQRAALYKGSLLTFPLIFFFLTLLLHI